MNKLFSVNTSKAIGGGAWAGLGYAASEPIAESITKIVVWFISMLADVPPEVRDAIDFVIRFGITVAIGYAGGWLAPPNGGTPPTILIQERVAEEPLG